MEATVEKVWSKIIVGFVWVLIFGIGLGFCALYLPELWAKNVCIILM